MLVAEMGFEPHDLRVMSPTSYRAAPLRDIHTVSSAYILSQSGKNVKCFSKISYSSESKNAYIFSSGFFCTPADSPKTIVSFFSGVYCGQRISPSDGAPVRIKKKNACRMMRQTLEVICCSCGGYNRHKAFDSFRELSCRPCSTGLCGRPAFLQFQNVCRISGRYPFDAHMQYVPFWN